MMSPGRRKFISKSLKATVATSFAAPLFSEAAHFLSPPPVKFEQVALPYSYASLEPSIDAMTMEIHYSKHHAAM